MKAILHTPRIKNTLCLVVAILLTVAAQAGIKPQADVNLSEAYAEAQQVAKMDHDWYVTAADGVSMAPFYDGDSILLVDRAPFRELKTGMIVVYRDHEGDLVGHRLVAKQGNQWVARGIQNGNNDPHFVSADNYQGVVFGIFYSNGQGKSALAGVDRVVGKTY